MFWFEVYSLLKETLDQWLTDKTTQLGAALAYYGAFAIAPLLVLAIAAAGAIYGESAAQGQLERQISANVGPTFAEAIQESLTITQRKGSGVWATIISGAAIFIAAMGLFGQLQEGLNTIWGVQVKSGRGLWGIVRDRLLSFVMVLIVSLLLLVSLVSNTVLAAIGKHAHLAGLQDGGLEYRLLNGATSFVLLTITFLLIYKVLPDVELRIKDVWVGAVLTTGLFLLGNYAIGLYLAYSGTASFYGAAGSLAIVLLWVYYSSQVILFGAEFTQVYACRYGHPIVSEIAEPIQGPAGSAKRVRCRESTSREQSAP